MAPTAAEAVDEDAVVEVRPLPCCFAAMSARMAIRRARSFSMDTAGALEVEVVGPGAAPALLLKLLIAGAG